MKHFFAAALLLAGHYHPTQGNEASICTQKVRPYVWDGELTGIDVTYTGDCADQGPFNYPCSTEGDDSKAVCESGGVRITVLTETQYRWENLDYGFEAVFVKDAKPPPKPGLR